MKPRFILSLLLLLSGPLAAYVYSPGALSFADPGARSAALGGSMAARAGSMESSHFNPAALAHIDRFQASFNFDIRKDDLVKPNISVALPLAGRRLFLGYNQLILTSTGDRTDMSYLRKDIPLGIEPDFRNLQTLTLAALPLKWLSIGGSFKVFLATGDGEQLDMAFDLGIYARIGRTGLTAGMAMQNIFLQLNPHHAPDPLPYIFRGAVAYRILNLFDHKVVASIDFINPEDRDPEIGIGAEYLFHDIFLFRTGFHTYDSLPRFGVGYRNRTVDVSLEIDFSWQKNESTGSVFTFGVTVGF